MKIAEINNYYISKNYETGIYECREHSKYSPFVVIYAESMKEAEKLINLRESTKSFQPFTG